MIAAGVLAGSPARANCNLGVLAEVPVTMNGLRPTIVAKINGTDTTFLVDSGAFFSNLSPAKAAELKLPMGPPPFELSVRGVGGSTEVSVARVKELTLFNIKIPRVDFLVGGSEPGDGISGLLGQNLLRIADIEYDLAHGVIRLVRPHGCDKADLAYWTSSQVGSQLDSAMDINSATPTEPHTTGMAMLNGAKIRVMFDTGAATSFVSVSAAERAGIKLDQPNVTPAGLSHGIGSRAVKTWIAPFASFKIGNEEIRNTRLRVGEFSMPNAEMLIGADFFLSHRIYVASSQRKLYFTYNGGPVFNLKSSPLAASNVEPERGGQDAQPAMQEGAQQAAQDPAPGGHVPQPIAPDPNEPTDAASFSRRGTAYAARRDFAHAIADLTRACDLDPNEPAYFYQRGMARLQNAQPQLAMADFGQALKLKPDDIPSLLSRAALRVRSNDHGGAVADLDVAQQAASKQSDARLEIGDLYLRAGQLEGAIAQYDLWVASHGQDARMADALSARGWARTLSGKDLDKALADANAALRRRSQEPQFLYRRAVAHLRAGDIDKAMADWNAVLKNDPQNPWALYGRGLTEARKGRTSDSQADISAATRLEPHIVDAAARQGLTP